MFLDPLTLTKITDAMIRCEIEMLWKQVEAAPTEQVEIVYLQRLRKLEIRLTEQAK